MGLAAGLLAGCRSLHLGPHTDTADGCWVGGSASLSRAASTARWAAEPPVRYWPGVYIESAPVTLSRYVDAPTGSGTQKKERPSAATSPRTSTSRLVITPPLPSSSPTRRATCSAASRPPLRASPQTPCTPSRTGSASQ